MIKNSRRRKDRHKHESKRAAICFCLLLANSASASPLYISLVDLVVMPEKYMGQKVMLIGFNSQRKVFLTESAAKYRDVANSVSFSDKREGYYDFCEEAFVRVRGVVARDPAGALFLKGVNSVYSMDEHSECDVPREVK